MANNFWNVCCAVCDTEGCKKLKVLFLKIPSRKILTKKIFHCTILREKFNLTFKFFIHVIVNDYKSKRASRATVRAERVCCLYIRKINKDAAYVLSIIVVGLKVDICGFKEENLNLMCGKMFITCVEDVDQGWTQGKTLKKFFYLCKSIKMIKFKKFFFVIFIFIVVRCSNVLIKTRRKSRQ